MGSSNETLEDGKTELEELESILWKVRSLNMIYCLQSLLPEAQK